MRGVDIHNGCYKRFWLLLAGLMLLGFKLVAQNVQNTDALLRQAYEQAYAGKWGESLQLCRQVLQQDSGYHDALILTGRIYAWQERFDTARIVLQPVVQMPSPPAGALHALGSLELWDGNPQKTLLLARKGLKFYPKQPRFIVLEVKALKALGEREQALRVLKPALQNHPDNSKLEEQLNELKSEKRNNHLKAGYQLTAFQADTYRNELSLEYGRKSGGVDVLARIRAGQQQEQDWQAELDVYPRLGKKAYSYLNVGFSGGKLFPTMRAGAELFYVLSEDFELSAGSRVFVLPVDTIVLYTGQIGWYANRYRLSLRPFFQKKNQELEATLLVQGRRYFEDNRSFVGLGIAKGGIPAGLLIQQMVQETRLNDRYQLSLEMKWQAGNYLLGGMLIYGRDKFSNGIVRDRLTTGINVQRMF